MYKSKLKFILALTAAAVLFTACGIFDKTKTAGGDTSGAASESSEESEEEEYEAPEAEEIDQDSADKFLSEKLDELDCRAVFSEYSEVDGVDVYLYSVVNKKEVELDQMLAVNAVSGEVMVYDYDNDKLLPFERFEYYVDSGSGEVGWDSKYYLEPRTVELMPADDNSFEFTIKKKGEEKPELEGVAAVDPGKKNEAVYEDDKVSLTFLNKGDTLEISDNGNISGLAGIYSRQE